MFVATEALAGFDGDGAAFDLANRYSGVSWKATNNNKDAIRGVTESKTTPHWRDGSSEKAVNVNSCINPYLVYSDCLLTMLALSEFCVSTSRRFRLCRLVMNSIFSDADDAS